MQYTISGLKKKNTGKISAVSPPLHYGEMKGVENLSLRHQAEFLSKTPKNQDIHLRKLVGTSGGNYKKNLKISYPSVAGVFLFLACVLLCNPIANELFLSRVERNRQDYGRPPHGPY